MMPSRKWCAAVAAVLVCAASPARADFPHPALYIGVWGGGNFVLRDWDLGPNSRSYGPNVKDHSGLFGGRLGVQLIDRLALEAEVAWLPGVKSNNNRDNTTLLYDLNLVFHFLKGNWTPTISAGVGMYHSLAGGDLGYDIDPRVHLGLGLRGMLSEWAAIRLDVRDVITDGFDKFGANNLEATLGVDFFIFGAKVKAPEPRDSDKDGIVDNDDECPSSPGPAATKGCPDKDGDGVADKDDQCVDVPAGSVPDAAKAGCPNDRDADGVIDENDQCVDVPAGKIPDEARKGCPADQDKDKVIDENDQCVDVPAGKYPDSKRAGCPNDRDADGVIDEKDVCIDVPAGKIPDEARKGCPADKDGDSVADETDACPDKAGAPDPDPKKNGCPGLVVVKEGQIKILEQVYFATNKDEILSKSFKVLKAVANAVKSLPVGRKVRVEGHTDNKGTPEKNQDLSQRRAESVKKYLVEKEGLPAERFEAKGFGQDKPIEDNATDSGRAKNRRVEFHIEEAGEAQ